VSGAVAAETSPMPESELAKPPLFRHIDFFDANKDGKLTVGEISDGLQRLGLSKLNAEVVAFGTVAVRGPSTTGKFNLQIDIANAMKSEQSGSTHIFGEDGSADPAKVEDFLTKLNPNGKTELTQDDFAAMGKRIAEERVPGSGLIDHAKRAGLELEFKLAWNGVFSAAGHTGADGKKVLTPDDVRWFYDGSLFYRRAAEVEAEKK
jgi:hypothetical protein